MRILFFLLLGAAWLQAETIFTLRGIDKVYPVVEIKGTKVPKSEKRYLRDELKATTDDLHIDTKGYSQRSLALLVSEVYAGKCVLIKVRLLIGEQVKRVDSAEKVFAITYQVESLFPYAKDSVSDRLEDTVDDLLAKFADQYREEHRTIKRIADTGGSIAQELGYETDFAKAIDKAKRVHKNVMLVVVSNQCPWCRKFEQQVLRRKEVSAAVQRKYVPVIVNKEAGKLPSEFNLSFTPIVYFIDPKTQKSYHRSVGYNEREAFMYWINTDKGP
jgi:thioredoxin-related protein